MQDKQKHAKLIFDFLGNVGANHAELRFSGGGDDGSVESVDVFDAQHQIMEIDCSEVGSRAHKALQELLVKHALLGSEPIGITFKNGDTPALDVSVLLEEYFQKHIDNSLGNWVDGEGGSGSVTFNVYDRTIEWEVSFNTTSDGRPVSGSLKPLRPTKRNANRNEFRTRLGLLFKSVAAASVNLPEADISYDCEGDLYDIHFKEVPASAFELYLRELPSIGLKLLASGKDQSVDDEFEAIVRSVEEKADLVSHLGDDGGQAEVQFNRDEILVQWTVTPREQSSDDGERDSESFEEDDDEASAAA
jgi:hypothetical protein